LLEIIMRDKTWNNEAARKTYVAILELMTPPPSAHTSTDPSKTAGGIELMGKSAIQADPLVELIGKYRRKLSMALN
jgi:putative thioredoxin